ncbi:hypothetical protein ACLKA6_013688 [Drosophila palustris]
MYYLKWKGYSREANTWEPLKHLNCSALIEEFEECERLSRKFGFDRGMEPAKLIRAMDLNGERMFLMSWKNSDKVDLVPAKVVNAKFPQMVLEFYMKRLTYDESVLKGDKQ